jgi:hypothetical protein
MFAVLGETPPRDNARLARRYPPAPPFAPMRLAEVAAPPPIAEKRSAAWA